MDKQQAKKIADLLNARNELVVQYDADRILAAAGNYLYLSPDANGISACVELKRVQWYQFEISHLTVASSREGKGDGRKLLQLVEECAIDLGGCVIQCTIRDNNCRSQHLFEKNGFVRTVGFYCPVSGNNVGVCQKSISAPTRAKAEL